MPSGLEQFLARPLRTRLAFGACAGLGIGLLAILIVLAAVVGGRYQVSHGREQDMWALAGLYPVGAVLGGIVGALCAPLWRNRWSAGLAAALVALPWIAMISIADDPHGPMRYHVRWPVTFGVATLFAVLVPILYPDLVRRAQARAAAARRSRGPRVSGRGHR